jgi:hypothetical protein
VPTHFLHAGRRPLRPDLLLSGDSTFIPSLPGIAVAERKRPSDPEIHFFRKMGPDQARA